MAYDVPATASTKRKKNYDQWEVESAMHTMMRAGEIVKDKKLLGLVKACARDHAQKMRETAAQADMLSKRGLISDKQMAKLKGGEGGSDGMGRLAKTAPLAKGNEGAGGSRRSGADGHP